MGLFMMGCGVPEARAGRTQEEKAHADDMSIQNDVDDTEPPNTSQQAVGSLETPAVMYTHTHTYAKPSYSVTAEGCSSGECSPPPSGAGCEVRAAWKSTVDKYLHCVYSRRSVWPCPSRERYIYGRTTRGA